MDTKLTAKIIADKRKEKGLTQIQLGELLNVSNRTISKWEKGDGLPDIAILPELSRVLEITIDELLTGQAPPTKEILVEKRDTNKLIRNFRGFYTVSLFFALFAAFLGTITEIYCIWAFPILFYTHWEIMFVAVSFCAMVASGLVYVLGLNNLHFEYSKKELAVIAGKRSLVLYAILTPFPISFIARIIDFSRYGKFTPYIISIILIALVACFIIASKKLKEITNEKAVKNSSDQSTD